MRERDKRGLVTRRQGKGVYAKPLDELPKPGQRPPEDEPPGQDVRLFPDE